MCIRQQGRETFIFQNALQISEYVHLNRIDAVACRRLE